MSILVEVGLSLDLILMERLLVIILVTLFLCLVMEQYSQLVLDIMMEMALTQDM